MTPNFPSEILDLVANKLKQKIKHPLFIAVAAFIILFVTLFSFYLKNYNSSNTQITNTSDETANWKTYTNTTHGVSFKYPADWKITKAHSRSKETDLPGVEPINNPPYKGWISPIFLNRHENPNQLSLEDWQKEAEAKSPVGRAALDFEKEMKVINIDGYKAYIVKNSNNNCDGAPCDLLIVMRNKDIIEVNYAKETISYSPQEIKTYQSIFETLISTIKFTR